MRVPVLANREQAEQIIARGVNRNDWNRKVIEKLGFDAMFVHPLEPREGHPEELQALYIRFCCGCYAEGMPNGCTIDLPIYQPASERVLRWDVLAQLMRIMVDTMDGDRGIIASHEHWDLVNDRAPMTEDPVGWLMYFSREQGVVPPLPAPVRIEHVGDKGTLVILTPERLTASNPEHVELGRQVRKLLSKAGLLKNPYWLPRPEQP